MKPSVDLTEAAVGLQRSLRRASELPPGPDPKQARRFLELLRHPGGGCTELRLLGAAWDARGRLRRASDLSPAFAGSTLAGWFEDLDRLCGLVLRLSGVSAYVTINPVRRDLLARSDHRLSRARHTTRDEDILCLRWLYLDIDPIRPAEISSTEEELCAAVCRRDAILHDHPELAASALWGRSGNGAWILVRLPDYPNDPHHRSLVAEAVRVLDRDYSDSSVRIDPATVNPARLIGLPGTLKAKGSHRPERPWRLATLEGIGPRADPLKQANH